MSNMMPGGNAKHPWVRPIDPAYFGDAPKAATGVAGVPGTWTPAGSVAPRKAAELTGVTASPATVWTTLQRVVLGDASEVYWNGTAWTAGRAP